MILSRNIVVINDEAHHAWTVRPDVEHGASKDDLEEATKWIEGLDRIHRARNLLKCYDFTATFRKFLFPEIEFYKWESKYNVHD